MPEALSAHQASPQRAPNPVPVEFIGKARKLRNAIVDSYADYIAASEHLLLPFRESRSGRPPRTSQKHLIRLGQNWKRLPGKGRLRCLPAWLDGTVSIHDLRLAPATLNLKGWAPDETEPGLMLVLRSFALRPGEQLFEERPLAILGLHAIARRFERGDRNEHQVIADTLPLGRAFPQQLRSGEVEFEIPAPSGGRWIGAMMQFAGRPILTVRTYIV
jgi:hypothetical protein